MNGCSRLRKDPEVAKYVVNLADRLRAIALMMASSPPASAHWPVLNARDLGYSDDLIALALWRLQSDAAPTPTSAVSPAAMTISPQVGPPSHAFFTIPIFILCHFECKRSQSIVSHSIVRPV